MPVRHELRKYNDGEKVWAGKYRNSHNMPHWHRDCELLYVESGSIDVFCRGKNRLLRPGEAMFIQSGEIHYMKAREETYLLVIIFTEELMKAVAGNSKLVSPACPIRLSFLPRMRNCAASFSRKNPSMPR